MKFIESKTLELKKSTSEIDKAAFREAIINAFCHNNPADYGSAPQYRVRELIREKQICAESASGNRPLQFSLP